LSVTYGICGAAARRLFAIQSARGSPDGPSALFPFDVIFDAANKECRRQ
jgi:hypothetical protein